MEEIDPKEQKKSDDDSKRFFIYMIISTLILSSIFEDNRQAVSVSVMVGYLLMKCDCILNELESIKKKLEE